MSKLNKNNESFYILLIIFGCLQQLISSELLTLIGIVYFIFLVIQSKIRIKLGWSKPIIILLLIFLIGSFVGLKNFYSRNYLRDIYYCINPIIILFIGMNLSNNKTENNKLLNSVVAISVLFAQKNGMSELCLLYVCCFLLKMLLIFVDKVLF